MGKYQKQPEKPDRKPEESITFVRNQEKLKKRIVVVPEKNVHPVQRVRPKSRQGA